MFEWLDEELTRIRTPKFHLLDGPASIELRQAVTTSDFPLPASYKAFVLRYGNARLYRRSSYWLVEVYAGPREAEDKDGRRFIQIGRTHTSLAYFNESKLQAGYESPVFEWYHQVGVRKTADGFEEWLISKCKAARKRFKKAEWESIEEGPPPFTEIEEQIVLARSQFRWRVIGITLNGDLRLEVHNGSAMILSYLSVGIRGKLLPPANGPLNGAAWLPVASIRPGETAVIEVNCYKKYIDPASTEVFELSEPGPEDREQYWEFKPTVSA
jgi:hypothetical protein